LFGVLKRAVRIRVRAWGRGPALLRHARKLGLICIASGTPTELRLDVSGPFALFRKTELYGRALASLLPEAARSEHFELEAECALGRGPELRTLRVLPSDPVFGPREALAYDSRLETRLVRDFEKLRTPWQVRLEPDASPCNGSLLVPSFELVSNQRCHRFEIVGYWTPQYLRDRLAELTAAHVENYVLCVDQTRPCGVGELPEDARILSYRTRLDAKALLLLAESKGEQSAHK
jgi:predicted nuclease of restriction endonuclease-like RecB superfamily